MPDQVLLSGYRIRLKGSPGTTFELLVTHEMAPNPGLNGDSDIHDTISSPKLAFAADPGKAGAQEALLDLLDIVPTLYPTKLAVSEPSRSAQTAFGLSRPLKT